MKFIMVLCFFSLNVFGSDLYIYEDYRVYRVFNNVDMTFCKSSKNDLMAYRLEVKNESGVLLDDKDIKAYVWNRETDIVSSYDWVRRVDFRTRAYRSKDGYELQVYQANGVNSISFDLIAPNGILILEDSAPYLPERHWSEACTLVSYVTK